MMLLHMGLEEFQDGGPLLKSRLVRPEHVCGEVAVKRVSALSRPGTETVVAAVRKVGDVDVQRRLEENRAD